MSRAIVFDTGPVISLTLNSLTWLLEPLKKRFEGNFYICPTVYQELIRKPLTTKKYKFEALQILPFIMDNTIEVYKSNDEVKEKTKYLMDIANNCFTAKGNPIKIVHTGEMEAIATALACGAETLVIDERTSRVLIENPCSLSDHFRKKLHTHIEINRDNVDRLGKEIGHLKVIRSVELAVIAYKLGLLDRYMLKEEEKLDEITDIRKSLLEGVLWAIKLSGCSVSRDEIYEIIDTELK